MFGINAASIIDDVTKSDDMIALNDDSARDVSSISLVASKDVEGSVVVDAGREEASNVELGANTNEDDAIVSELSEDGGAPTWLVGGTSRAESLGGSADESGALLDPASISEESNSEGITAVGDTKCDIMTVGETSALDDISNDAVFKLLDDSMRSGKEVLSNDVIISADDIINPEEVPCPGDVVST